MTPEAQRIAIAEACGWTPVKVSYGTCWVRKTPTYAHCKEAGALPNYLNDLNAMHEAEKVLTDEQWEAYAHALFEITHPHDDCGSFEGIVRATSHATAAQRAEAFLRTLNLWTP